MADQGPGLPHGLTRIADAIRRTMAGIVSTAVEHGPEVLVSLANVQVEVEHFELLQSEWSNHPLVDFIMWQEARVGRVMAMTLPQDAISGHATLGRLLEPVCTADAVVGELDRVAREPSLSGWSADEFRHGLEHVSSDELSRALTPLTVGLEGLIRTSAIERGLLAKAETDALTSGSQLVRALWGRTGPYESYMKSWVFGMANVYRHGGDHGTSVEQALHVLCGASIWAKHVLELPKAFEAVEHRLGVEVWNEFSRGALQLQPDAEKRLRRAAVAAGKTDYVRSLLDLRQQLLDARNLARDC